MGVRYRISTQRSVWTRRPPRNVCRIFYTIDQLHVRESILMSFSIAYDVTSALLRGRTTLNKGNGNIAIMTFLANASAVALRIKTDS